MKKMVIWNWDALEQHNSTPATYQWGFVDIFACIVSSVSLGFLIYLTQAENDIVHCGEDVANINSFTGSQVSVLNRRCEEHSGLFACVIVSAASFQYVRALLSSEVGQERRVILGKDKHNRPAQERFWFHARSCVLSTLGIFGTVLIITQNLWVFLTLIVSYEAAMYRYLLNSPADAARAHVSRMPRSRPVR